MNDVTTDETPIEGVHRIIKRMQDECAELGPCTDDMPCQACMQLARLDGEIRGRFRDAKPVYDEATVVLLRELRSMAEEGALYEIRKRIRKALDTTELPVVAEPLRDELRQVLTLPWDARLYQYQRAITRALDILDADGTKKGQ